jgi:[ribosomal protein S5]-alanine N-acetyltransferase
VDRGDGCVGRNGVAGLDASLLLKAILELPRLFLRELESTDIEFVAEMLGHPEVMRYWPRPYTRDEAVEWIQRHRDLYSKDGHGYWLLLEKEAGQPVGQAGLLVHEIDGRREIGLGYIIHRPYWRRGFAIEAAGGCLAFGFETLKRDSMVALIRPENLPSQGVARKLGMTPGRDVLHAGLVHTVFTLGRESWNGR